MLAAVKLKSVPRKVNAQQISMYVCCDQTVRGRHTCVCVLQTDSAQHRHYVFAATKQHAADTYVGVLQTDGAQHSALPLCREAKVRSRRRRRVPRV